MKELNTIREVNEAILDGMEVEFKCPDKSEWLPVESLYIPARYIDYKTKYIYRTKPSKPSINWSHVSEEFRYLARDEDGKVYLYKDKPDLEDTVWFCHTGYGASAFKSLDIGNCHWSESLVKRPE